MPRVPPGETVRIFIDGCLRASALKYRAAMALQVPYPDWPMFPGPIHLIAVAPVGSLYVLEMCAAMLSASLKSGFGNGPMPTATSLPTYTTLHFGESMFARNRASNISA